MKKFKDCKTNLEYRNVEQTTVRIGQSRLNMQVVLLDGSIVRAY